jgi:outer membrane scaffolding protein for murein synthesis (MipA/OmpV family)
MRKTPSLTIGAALIVALLNNGLAIAQPASTWEAVVDPVDTRAGQGMNFTLGAGVGAAPDYEGQRPKLEPIPGHYKYMLNLPF